MVKVRMVQKFLKVKFEEIKFYCSLKDFLKLFICYKLDKHIVKYYPLEKIM